jgi:hypothetical protein
MISADDRWMPWGLPRQTDDGFWDLGPTLEAELGKTASFLTANERIAMTRWWLAIHQEGARTPNWDIASTCTIDGRRGLLLIEAKAHDAELNTEACGKRLDKHASLGGVRNHDRIETAIAEANDGLARATGLKWGLARDSHYQLSNRFAWAWKAVELGLCVVLVYLGFLNADEMNDRGLGFADHRDWEAAVRSHAASRVPFEAWNRRWMLHGQIFFPLIRSYEVPLRS